MLDLRGPFFYVAGRLDFGALGHMIVGLLVAAWVVSLALWKFGRIEERHAHLYGAHVHKHTHESGVSHHYKHFH